MTSPTPPTNPQDDAQLKAQASQARRVLIRLQWLMIVLLASGLFWLYNAFMSISVQVQNKLATIDTIDIRLNSMDDRLFALTSLYGQKPIAPKTNTNKDTELIKVQLTLAHQLYKQGKYDEAITALTAINLQLDQATGMASPIKTTLNEALNADIAYIKALKNQPDTWQAHIIKMRDLQAFLKKQQPLTATTAPLSHRDVLLHDVSILLSLAVSSANIRDKTAMTSYLQEVKSHLESHIIATGGSIVIEKQGNGSPPLFTLNDALYWVYELLANSPKDKPLQSSQILK